jgi:trigger factor
VREFEVAYPEDYPQKSLAGKSLHYRVEVQSIKKKVVPALDDELAKSVSEFSKLEELRVKLREDLKERRTRAVGGAAKQKLVEQLLQAHPIPVPKVVVERQLNRRLERVLTQLMAQGIDPRATEVDWSKVREESRPEAEKEVRASLILGKIAEAEGIQVSEDEVDELVREMSKEGQETPAALKTRLTRDGELDRIVAIRRNQKALDFIYSNARIIRKNGPDPARVEG